MSVAAIERELQRRRKKLERALLKERDALTRRVATIDDELLDLRGDRRLFVGYMPGNNRTYAHNTLRLPDAISHVLRGREMTVPQIAQTLRASGYKTTAKNFEAVVRERLREDNRRFPRVGRGLYTVR